MRGRGEPPAWIVDIARAAAERSPCAKSKRGVVLFNREREDERVRNEIPTVGLVQSAIIAGVGFNGPPAPMVCDGSESCRRDCAKTAVHAEHRAILSACTLDDVHDLELVHVKVVDGKVVAGGPPSCWQCSRLILDSQIADVWLYEADEFNGPQWFCYAPIAFHRKTLIACGLHVGDLDPTLHVLWGGRALCDAPYLQTVPSEWPDGQSWVSLASLADLANGATVADILWARESDPGLVVCRQCELRAPGMIGAKP